MAGGTISIPLAHYHTVSGVHPSVLMLGPAGIGLVPLGRACNQRKVAAAFREITFVEAKPNMYGEQLLNVKFRDPENAGKVLNFNFGAADAQMDKSGFIPIMRSGAQAPLLLRSLAQTLEALRAQ